MNELSTVMVNGPRTFAMNERRVVAMNELRMVAANDTRRIASGLFRESEKAKVASSALGARGPAQHSSKLVSQYWY